MKGTEHLGAKFALESHRPDGSLARGSDKARAHFRQRIALPGTAVREIQFVPGYRVDPSHWLAIGGQARDGEFVSHTSASCLLVQGGNEGLHHTGDLFRQSEKLTVGPQSLCPPTLPRPISEVTESWNHWPKFPAIQHRTRCRRGWRGNNPRAERPVSVVTASCAGQTPQKPLFQFQGTANGDRLRGTPRLLSCNGARPTVLRSGPPRSPDWYLGTSCGKALHQGDSHGQGCCAMSRRRNQVLDCWSVQRLRFAGTRSPSEGGNWPGGFYAPENPSGVRPGPFESI